MRLIGLAVVLALGLALAPLTAGAQQTEKVRRIGFLAGTNRAEPYDALPQGLRELGYVEGQNLRIEWRFAEGRTDRIAGLTAELVSLNVEVIVAVAPDCALCRLTAVACRVVFERWVTAEVRHRFVRLAALIESPDTRRSATRPAAFTFGRVRDLDHRFGDSLGVEGAGAAGFMSLVKILSPFSSRYPATTIVPSWSAPGRTTDPSRVSSLVPSVRVILVPDSSTLCT
jgi:hypothetical protein